MTIRARTIFKGLAFLIMGALLVLCLLFVVWQISLKSASKSNMALLGDVAPRLSVDGHTFRDLNKNGQLDIYEDSRASIESRVSNLMRQMTLEEKAGVMFINFTLVGPEGELVEGPIKGNVMSLLFSTNSELVARKHMNHFSLIDAVNDPEVYISWHNKMQNMGERTRLGIPITFASDPRHGIKGGGSISLPSGAFSKWPEPLGLAAAGDPDLVQAFANMARQEYRAAGIHVALHPVADLATEPRWSRISGTFGEDAKMSAKFVSAYVRGMQGEALGPKSVATMVKHFSGGGPQKDGEDAHFPYGKHQVYPGDNFDYHLIPFEEGAFPAGAAQIMPYYGIPVGQTDEDVGFAYSRYIITDLLREKYGFDGVICTDWGLVSDAKFMGRMILEARAWGAENLTHEERMLKLLEAGNDMFGGEESPEMLAELVRSGKVPEARLDPSVRRILTDKFELGLFDNPYTDIEIAASIIGQQTFVDAGRNAQRKSLVLLKNGADDQAILPLQGRPKLYIENIDIATASRFGEIVDTPDKADFAILRLETPYEKRDGLIESALHAGDLDFKEPEKSRLLNIMKTVPTITNIYVDRGVVMPEMNSASAALIADFGASDDIVLEMIFGVFAPAGKMPIELPSSMETAAAQFEDVPYDSKDPLYAYGFGLTYP